MRWTPLRREGRSCYQEAEEEARRIRYSLHANCEENDELPRHLSRTYSEGVRMCREGDRGSQVRLIG